MQRRLPDDTGVNQLNQQVADRTAAGDGRGLLGLFSGGYAPSFLLVDGDLMRPALRLVATTLNYRVAVLVPHSWPGDLSLLSPVQLQRTMEDLDYPEADIKRAMTARAAKRSILTAELDEWEAWADAH